jgi:hypothetical protein
VEREHSGRGDGGVRINIIMDIGTQASFLGNGAGMRLAGVAIRKEVEGNSVMEQNPF